jgi:uncharacterized protein YndB with AHSA1/START domain
MPTSSDTRLLPVVPQPLWELVSDPHHLPRWWPRVERVEGVGDAAFTEVLRSERGRLVRADFEVVERDDVGMRLIWAQQVEGTPFARVLAASEIEVRVQPRTGSDENAGSDVTITLTQTPHAWLPAANTGPAGAFALLDGLFARVGGPMVRKAAEKTVRGALDGLERIAA